MTWQGLEHVRVLMKEAGADRLYAKALAANDNSKNQPYFRGDLTILNVLPSEELSDFDAKNPKFSLDFHWLTPDGRLHRAPKAKLIFYSDYPEVRFSGFLADCDSAPNDLMNTRLPGRVLFLGVTRDGKTIGLVSPPESSASIEFRKTEATLEHIGVLAIVPLSGEGTHAQLFAQLRRIHMLEWIDSKKLGSDGRIDPCNAMNCGGYTLEAELGVVPNGRCEPDFHGWEVKQHAVRDFAKPSTGAITLMTPEPKGGVYAEEGVEVFVRRYGYKDKMGRADRLNFGGIHRVGQVCEATGLAMEIAGYDPVAKHIVDISGAIRLLDPKGRVAASWPLLELLASWKRKHSRAVYVPSQMRKTPRHQYRYHHTVRLGFDTELVRLLDALYSGDVYYDPGIKLEQASTAKPKAKKRSQFRTTPKSLHKLYARMEVVSVLG